MLETESGTDIKKAEEIGKLSKNKGVVAYHGSAGGVVAGSLLSGSNASPFIKFTQKLKLYSRLRYLGINFGKILSSFLEGISNFEKDSIANNDDLVYYEDSYNYKLSKYKVNLMMFDKLHYKVALYIFSYALKLLDYFFTKKMRKQKKVIKYQCSFIYYHQKVHFIVFNMWVVDMSFFSMRDIMYLNSAYDLKSFIGIILAYLVMIMILNDLVHIYVTSEQLKQIDLPLHFS